jgi:hypothetical protein
VSRSRAKRALAGALLLLASAGCEDPALRRLDERAEKLLVEARAIAANREHFQRSYDVLARDRAGLLESFQRMGAPGGLEAVVEAVGGTVEQVVPRSVKARTPRAVAFRVDGAGRIEAMLRTRTGGRLPVTLELLRCDEHGCTGELSAIPRPTLRPGDRPPTPGDLPTRPRWPPERARWERAKANLEQLTALRADLGPLLEVREGIEEVEFFRKILRIPRIRGELVVQAARDALASGADEVEAVAFDHEDGYGVRVLAPGANQSLASRLMSLGTLSTEGAVLVVTVVVPEKAAERALVEKLGRH